MRHTRAHTANRRSHHALEAATLSVCKNCGAHHRPHHMCLACGFYKGRQVMDLAAAKEAREKRMQAKREMIRGLAAEAEEREAAHPSVPHAHEQHEHHHDPKALAADNIERKPEIHAKRPEQ